MDPASNQSDPGARPPKTALPPRRSGPPRELGALPEVMAPGTRRDPGAAGPGTVPRGVEAGPAPERGGGSAADPEARGGPIPPLAPVRLPARRNKVAVVIFSVLVPVAMFALVVSLVFKLDEQPSGEEPVSGGVVHRMADGLIGVQEDPDSDQKVYYLVLAPREAEARMEFGDRSMAVTLRTEGGMREVSRSVNWEEAPYAMLIKYVELYGDTPKIPCPPGLVEGYLSGAGKETRVAPLAVQLENPAQGAP